jgi:hypothetical protein
MGRESVNQLPICSISTVVLQRLPCRRQCGLGGFSASRQHTNRKPLAILMALRFVSLPCQSLNLGGGFLKMQGVTKRCSRFLSPSHGSSLFKPFD